MQQSELGKEARPEWSCGAAVASLRFQQDRGEDAMSDCLQWRDNGRLFNINSAVAQAQERMLSYRTVTLSAKAETTVGWHIRVCSGSPHVLPAPVTLSH